MCKKGLNMQARLSSMEKALARKMTKLRDRIRKLDGALVAFSGGVDSTFLMRICRDELGDKAVAVTTLSRRYPRSELTMARRVAKILGVRHLVVKQKTGDEESAEPGGGPRAHAVHGANVYSQLKSVAMRMKLGKVIDGSHRDDKAEKGCSFIAAKQAGIHSPLLESDLSKAEIRLLARELGLPNWNRPSSAEKRMKRLPKAAAIRSAKAYLSKAAPSASLSFRGARAIISVDRRKGLLLLSKLGRIQSKLRKLGFSEVILKVCNKGRCKKVRSS